MSVKNQYHPKSSDKCIVWMMWITFPDFAFKTPRHHNLLCSGFECEEKNAQRGGEIKKQVHDGQPSIAFICWAAFRCFRKLFALDRRSDKVPMKYSIAPTTALQKTLMMVHRINFFSIALVSPSFDILWIEYPNMLCSKLNQSTRRCRD